MGAQRLLLVSPFLCLAGCGIHPSNSPEADEIGAALELENGGLSLDDEVPAFGDESVLRAADVPEEPGDDPVELDPAVLPLADRPEARAYEVTVWWGQIPGNRDNERIRDWTGAFAVNRGAILVRRRIAFELNDRLLPRDNPRIVPFTSATRPHMDGLVLTLLDPEPTADEPLLLGYRGRDGTEVVLPMPLLADHPVTRVIDDAGNRMVAVGGVRPLDPCAHGFLRGRWESVAEGRGRLLGGVVDADGNLIGHIRGIYGVRASGEPVFFGKYIALDGTFRGIFAGHYGDGRFAGRWLSRSDDRGVLGGTYRETPEEDGDGHFLGRWEERTCISDPR